MFGPLIRRSTAASASVLLVMLGSCAGGGDGAATDAAVVDLADSGARPERLVEQRWDAYWDARVASENSGRLGEAFTEVASGKALEAQTRRLRNYAHHDLVRVGQPEFRDVRVRVSEDSATVLACMNADDWTAIAEGRPWSARKYGWELTGSVMKQVDGTWLVVDEMSTEDVADMGATC